MTLKPWSVAVCLAAVHLSVVVPGHAQTPPGAPRRLVADGLPGVNTFRPQRWGVVGVTVANPSDRPAEVLSSHYFGDQSDRQFARQLWIPARAKRAAWHPVLPPANSPRGMSLPVKSLLIDRSHEREVVIGDRGDTLTHDGLLPTQPDTSPVTGLIADPDDAHAARTVQVARVALTLPPRVARLDGDSLPPTTESLQALDQLVVASDRPAADPAGCRAIRGWLHGGGRLWVRLDRVAPGTAALLLGEDFPGTVVDRVELTRWQFEQERASADPDDELYDTPRGKDVRRTDGAIDPFEAPVEMARVLVPGVRPVHTIGGWPASFWVRSGRGLVLFTTVGPRVWVNPRPEGDRAKGDPQNPVAGYEETEPLRQLARPFLKPRDGPLLKPQAFTPLVSAEVGHRVVGRGTVLAVLGAFCVALAAGGWWFGRRGDLAHLGWAGPAAAVGAALVLVVVGYSARTRVPPTLAVAQLVEIAPGAEDAPVTGLLALYNPEGAAAPLGAERGGAFLPDMKGQGGTTRRMVRTDLDRWHWENLDLPPGLHLAPFEVTARLSEPVSARATFGPGGVSGTLALGPFREPADAIIALPSRRHVAVRLSETGFTAGPSNQLAPGQFLAAEVLSEAQRHRQAVYRELLDQRVWPRYPARPTLLVWAAPLDLGFTFVEGARRSGAALLAIPLALDRPAPGTVVKIPAPFLPYQPLTGDGLTLLHDPKHNDWVGPRAAPARAVLRVQVPRELLPLRVERAVIDADVSAPGRPFEVSAGPTVLATRSGPTGRVRIEIDNPDALRPDAGGAIDLGLAVGAGPGEWRINDLQIELTGRVPEERGGE
jgi:hypothetical protein